MRTKTPASKNTYLTIQALKRMPYYLQFLKQAQKEGKPDVSAAQMAQALQLNDVLVRKDIASVSSTGGRPKAGFPVSQLIHDIESYMGYHTTKEAVLVGVGSLGKALLRNEEFEMYGFRIVAAFDNRRSMYHKKINGIEIFSVSKLKEFCLKRHIPIGIITVPTPAAQEVADRLVDGGVQAIWNFAFCKLSVPDRVLVQNEDLASSLAMLSQHLRLESEMRDTWFD